MSSVRDKAVVSGQLNFSYCNSQNLKAKDFTIPTADYLKSNKSTFYLLFCLLKSITVDLVRKQDSGLLHCISALYHHHH